jgi:hypothetical protein
VDRDRTRQALIAVTFLITIAVNSAANVVPLNGQSTAAISDRFRVFVTPAGYVFAIWGAIYLFQLLFVVHTLRPSRRTDPLLRRIGLLPALASVLNGVWIVAWHWEVFPATVAIMVGLLLTLIATVLRAGFDRTARRGSRLPRADRWLVQVPFSIYLGWITVATIANVAAVGNWAGVSTFGLAPQAVAAAVLVVGLLIAVTNLLRTGDIAFGLVIVWAYVGIVVKEAAALTPYVPLVAGASALIVAVMVAAAAARLLPLADDRERASARP